MSLFVRIYDAKNKLLVFVVLLLLLLLFAEAGRGADLLEENFMNPPAGAGVRCFWWWLNGNVTRQAITRDLEEMKAKGFSGALIVDADGAAQGGNYPVPAGPAFLSTKWRELFKHALKEADRLGLELSLNIQSGWDLGGPNVTTEMAAKMLTWSQIQIEGPLTSKQKLPEPARKKNFYKDVAVLAYPLRQAPNVCSKPAEISHLASKTASREVGWAAPDCRFLLDDTKPTEAERYQYIDNVVDITDKMSPDGTLQWEVPEGKWVVLRFGYTVTGAKVSTSSAGWKGLVLDYLDRSVFKKYWEQVIAPLIEDAGPLAGKTLKYLHTDSWECGGANWTKNFRREFIDRRGYDPIRYLPVIAGKIVENRDISNRFLADFRKTIGDCVTENHYGYLAELASKHNMGIHPESGGPHAGPFDAIKNLGRSDIVMGEYWVPSPHRPRPFERFYVKQSASTAHIYGKKLVGAEAFTSIGPHWTDVFWKAQKPSFDHEACSGLNLNFIHTFTCSPEKMGLPGQEYFAGTHFNPNCTWWEYADGFLDYLHRCQYLFQQGKFVADVLYYYGDHVPNLVRLKEADPAEVMPGYDYDVTNEEILLRLKVTDECILVPGGVSYCLLVLPDHKVLSLAALRKVHELLRQGATVIGAKPQRQVTLTGLPQSENEFKKLTDMLWGNSPDSEGQKNLGKGRLIWGKNAREVLTEDGITPDFETSCKTKEASFDYIHYKIKDADVYFVCNQKEQQVNVVCTFRISGKQPELWDPLTGQIRYAKAFEQIDGRTKIPIIFAPYGSWFVVLRKPVPNTLQGKAKSNFPDYRDIMQIQGPWQVYFDKRWGGPGQVEFKKLTSWTASREQGVRFYSGKAVYKTTFDMAQMSRRQSYVLDLGDVLDIGIARVRLNGKDMPIIWTKPFRVDITSAIKQGQNLLEVDVINSWRNRLIGDKDLPDEKSYTRTNIKIRKKWQTLDSGLMGPVKIITTSN